jgi:hypothetical protein
MARIAGAFPRAEDRASLAYLALYACGYGGRGGLARFGGLRAARADPAFQRSLASRIGDEVVVSDWTLTGWTADQALIERAGVRAFVERSRVARRSPAVGRRVGFRVPALQVAATGFVHRRPTGAGPTGPVSRFYLNIGAAHASWVLGPLARELERVTTVAVKVLAHPRAYLRRDAAVVYVSSSRAASAFRIIDRAVSRDGVPLAPPVPLLTLRLAPGVGFADEPSDLELDGVSYGRWVSSLFVHAVDSAAEAGAIARSVAGLIAECGRDPERPYLRPGRGACLGS